MKKDKLKVYLLQFMLAAILAFALFVPSFSREILAAGLTIASGVVCYALRKRNILSINKKTVTIMYFILAVIYLVAFYLMRFIFWIL